MSVLNVTSLAKEFVDVTVNKIGTTEEVVFEILKQVHDEGVQKEFDNAVQSFMSQDDIAKLKPHGVKNIVPFILQDELSLADYTKAEDLYYKGADTYRADGWDHLSTGILNMLDMSETTGKVALGVAVGLPIAAKVLTAAGFIAAGVAITNVVIIAGAVLVVGGAIYGLGKIAKNGIEIAMSNTEAEQKGNIKELGEGIGIAAPCGLFVPKSIQAIKALAAARAAKSAAIGAESAEVVSEGASNVVEFRPSSGKTPSSSTSTTGTNSSNATATKLVMTEETIPPSGKRSVSNLLSRTFNPSTIKKADAWLARAKMLEANGNNKAAIKAYNNALYLYDGFVGQEGKLAHCYMKLGELGETPSYNFFNAAKLHIELYNNGNSSTKEKAVAAAIKAYEAIDAQMKSQLTNTYAFNKYDLIRYYEQLAQIIEFAFSDIKYDQVQVVSAKVEFLARAAALYEPKTGYAYNKKFEAVTQAISQLKQALGEKVFDTKSIATEAKTRIDATEPLSLIVIDN